MRITSLRARSMYFHLIFDSDRSLLVNCLTVMGEYFGEYYPFAGSCGGNSQTINTLGVICTIYINRPIEC